MATGINTENKCLFSNKTHNIILFLLLILAVENVVANSCSKEIRRGNIIGNAAFSLLFRSFNKEVHDWSDVREALIYGGSAGYLFYKSRSLIGKGDESRGLATNFLASSITENVTLGQHPIASLRYGIGPIEIKWKTPFATQDFSRSMFGSHSGKNLPITFAVNAIDLVNLLSMGIQNDARNFKLRNGVITATDNSAIEDDYSAYSIGRTVITKEEFVDDQELWHHELIHTTQYSQFSSFGSTNLSMLNLDQTPLNNFIETPKNPSRKQHLFSLRVEWFNSLINRVDQNQPYENRWREVEAYALAQETSPFLTEENQDCTVQLGFQFQF